MRTRINTFLHRFFKRLRLLRTWVKVALLFVLLIAMGGLLWHFAGPVQLPSDHTAIDDSQNTSASSSTTETTDTLDTTKAENSSSDVQSSEDIKWLERMTARELAEYNGEALYYENGVAYRTATGERCPVMALTFDDGPSYLTVGLIDELNKRSAKATFFVLGVRVESYPEAVEAAVEGGHLLCSHGWDHKSSLTNLTEAQIDEQLGWTDNAVFEASGQHTLYVRPPYGMIDKETAALVDYPMMLWNIDPRDWDVRNADKVYKGIVDNAFDGGVVICHDIYDTTVTGVLSAVDALQEQGYQFVTLDKYYEIFDISPQNGEVWRGKVQADI